MSQSGQKTVQFFQNFTILVLIIQCCFGFTSEFGKVFDLNEWFFISVVYSHTLI